MDYWVIGFLWGSARFSGQYLLVQNLDRSLVEKVKNISKIDNEIFTIKTTSDKTSYRIKIRLDNRYVQHMLRNGYEGRKGNLERKPPRSLTAKNEYDFLKGYFCTHYSYDHVKNQPRLRFYASYSLLDLLNQHLHNEICTTVKKIADHGSNDVCKILYYQSKKEVPKIIEYLKLEVELS